MTIRIGIFLVLFSAFFVGACVTTSGRRGGLTEKQTKSLPAELTPDYVLFSKRCSRCHTLSRPLNASIRTSDHWRAYVNRMRRNPSSGISPRDGKSILRFLEYWTKHRQEVLALEEGSD